MGRLDLWFKVFKKGIEEQDRQRERKCGDTEGF